jgi:xanthine dehydrogenase molybdenum-binding subunit
MVVGKSEKRVDAFDKVTGRAQYTDDLCDSSAYVARVLHATVAHGKVLSIDTSEAEKVEGVIKILTCFDLKEKHYFATPGHPWVADTKLRDVEDRLILTDTVRFYGDDIGAVVAENALAAAKALRLIRVRYEEYPFVLDVQEAMKEGAPQLHEDYPGNVLEHTEIREGNFAEAICEPGLTKVEGWYETPIVQACHIENFICFAEMRERRIRLVTSTQVPHAARRITAQALGLDCGQIRVIKPYIGGGFGNKQDILYEPLCAWLCLQCGGHAVKIDMSREETLTCNRVRHAFRMHMISWLRPDGSFAARKLEVWSDQGAYASHGHAVLGAGIPAFRQLYPCANLEIDAWTVFTNKTVAGAMRGYGNVQMMWAIECHMEDIAVALKMDPLTFRRRNVMPVGYWDPYSEKALHDDSFNQCLDRAMETAQYARKKKEYRNQTGNIRRGIGAALFWFDTGVAPAVLETSSCRMTLNQDGSLQVQLGETEIGQGADTVFSQMAADAVGVPFDKVHVLSFQDTDVSPFGSGAYASRQTHAAGFSIRRTGQLLKKQILDRAEKLVRIPASNLDVRDGKIVRLMDGLEMMDLGALAKDVLYNRIDSDHLSAEDTSLINTSPYTLGCTVAEVEVDVALCRIRVLNLVNCHDAGVLINPALAEAQVHGGMSMGLGYGLSEKLVFDEKTGRPLNGNLLDYKLLTCMDHPTLTAEFVQNPEPFSAFGEKGLGETPVCSVAPAIRNAVFNATGVGLTKNPMDPQNLYEAFVKAGLIEGR